jgi:AraC-like DNA-binding protein
MVRFNNNKIEYCPPSGDGVEGYQEAISKTYGPMIMESSSGSNSKWEVDRLDLRSLVFSHIKYDGLVHARVPSDRDSYEDKNIVLMCIESGAVEQRLGNIYSTYESDTLVMFNMGKQLEIWQEMPVDVLSVKVPTHFLAKQCANIEKYCGIPVSSKLGAPAILRDMLRGVFRESDYLGTVDQHYMSAAFGCMISSVFHNNNSFDDEYSVLNSYQERILKIIESEIQNVDLSPQLIADRLGISRSYLFSITRKLGFSISNKILDERLNCCREILDDKSWASRSITEIAFTWGFKELSHFSRKFAQKFGVSPRLYREQLSPRL